MNHPSKRIRVLVVDDHPVVAFGLTAGLQPESDIEVIGSVLTIDAGLAFAETEKPDVIVADVVFGDRPRGLELVDRFGSSATAPAILLFSNYTPPSIVTLALEHGACGYITKEASPAEIATAIRTVASGGIYVSRDLLNAAKKAPDHPSPREMEIIAAIATGATNKEIAASLGIGVRTVETHLERCFGRYEVSSRAELVALAMREHRLGSR
jgi:DNA-binding NarL/FixJ family response regulator